MLSKILSDDRCCICRNLGKEHLVLCRSSQVCEDVLTCAMKHNSVTAEINTEVE